MLHTHTGCVSGILENKDCTLPLITMRHHCFNYSRGRGIRVWCEHKLSCTKVHSIFYGPPLLRHQRLIKSCAYTLIHHSVSFIPTCTSTAMSKHVKTILWTYKQLEVVKRCANVQIWSLKAVSRSRLNDHSRHGTAGCVESSKNPSPQHRHGLR